MKKSLSFELFLFIKLLREKETDYERRRRYSAVLDSISNLKTFNLIDYLIYENELKF